MIDSCRTELPRRQRRLVILIQSLTGGGAERVATNLGNEYAKRGWAVTIATLAEEEDYYPVDSSVRRVVLRIAGGSSGTLDAIRRNFVRLRILRRFLRKERPDVVLAMMTTTAVLAILASRGLAMRVVAAERIHPPMLPIGRSWDLCRRLTYPLADRVVVLTTESKRWLESHVRGVRVAVIPNPVLLPLPAGEPILRPDQVISDGRKVLLAVGRLDPQKGFDMLIDAFARLADGSPDWVMAIAGEGPDRKALAAQARDAGLGSRVLLLGQVGNLSDWYRRADLFVLSSRFEGFPNALLEAMAHGCPAVSFDCETGPRDIVRHDVDGLLVRPVGDVEALSGALHAAMADEQFRVRLKSNACAVAERFSFERVMRSWEDVLVG